MPPNTGLNANDVREAKEALGLLAVHTVQEIKPQRAPLPAEKKKVIIKRPASVDLEETSPGLRRMGIEGLDSSKTAPWMWWLAGVSIAVLVAALLVSIGSPGAGVAASGDELDVSKEAETRKLPEPERAVVAEKAETTAVDVPKVDAPDGVVPDAAITDASSKDVKAAEQVKPVEQVKPTDRNPAQAKPPQPPQPPQAIPKPKVETPATKNDSTSNTFFDPK